MVEIAEEKTEGAQLDIGTMVRDADGYIGKIIGYQGDNAVLSYRDEAVMYPVDDIVPVSDTSDCTHQWIYTLGKMRCILCSATRRPKRER